MNKLLDRPVKYIGMAGQGITRLKYFGRRFAFSALLAMFILLILPAAGCLKDPVHTRTSQPPAGSSGTWETPAIPEVVLTNLIFAYNEKNIQNYRLCLDDDFIFSDPVDSIDAEAQGFGYLYYDWGWEIEMSVTGNIFTAFTGEHDRLSLIMSPDSDYPDSIGDTLAVLYRDYILRAVKSDTSGSDTTMVEGLAAFHLSQPTFNLWSLFLWEELPSGRAPRSWGSFKAGYRNH